MSSAPDRPVRRNVHDGPSADPAVAPIQMNTAYFVDVLAVSVETRGLLGG